jgi:gliding motility-associated protein GldM
MAAVDTTMQPEIYINGSRVNLRGGKYSFGVGGVGEHSFGGYLLTHNAAGETIRRDFSQKYSVIPSPSGATVAADLMNVLYAGYQNPMSVSVPGVPQNAVSVSMSGGSLTAKGDGHYIATPSAVGKDVVFTVSANQGGQSRQMAQVTFKVRKLPDPTPYILVGDNRFRGGKMAKGSLMGLNNLRAAIDDGLLDIEFRVTGFEAVFYDNMGNAVPMASNGAQFSERQKDAFRKLSRNRRFYITHVQAIGPDGIARTLPGAMEIIVN